MDTLSAHGLRSTTDPSRRGFLISMIGAGVMLGYARRSLADQTTASASELFEPTIWYGINPNGEVTINITRAEMDSMSAPRSPASWPMSWRPIGVRFALSPSTPIRNGAKW